MKICKNDLDIILYPDTRCSICAFRMSNVCFWLKTVGKHTLNCGGIRVNILSDIFKL